jgi:membrane carboxypeptidase/penicillin-binding protein PbpC
MIGHELTQGAVILRAVIDMLKMASALLPPRRKTDKNPMYRLVARDATLLRHLAAADDLIGMHYWPR